MKHKRIIAALTGLCIAAGSMLSMGVFAKGNCDCNDDGDFDILDLIALSKYIHLQGDLKAPENADMDGDGEVDVFDLALMMRALVGLENEDYTIEATNLSAKVEGQAVTSVTLGEDFSLGQTQFALDLLRYNLKEGENSLVSPYSVSQALGMTANGAKGQTLSEMESVLGGRMDDLNHAFYTFRRKAMNDEFVTLDSANSIWVREGYPVSDAFLQTNADYYDADAYATPMDASTIKDVNHWVDKNTDHMIPGILPEGQDLVDMELILVNAVAFDAKWEFPYNPACDEYNRIFTAADGTEQEVPFMYGEFYSYLSDEHASGFMQRYEGGKYAFAAILPEEGMTPEQYLDTVTAEGFCQMLSSPESIHTYTRLPEFEYDYSVTLSDGLKAMGMPTAFDDANADFTGMADIDTGLYISDVLHKTHIEVNTEGTRAAAATAVLVADGAAPLEDYREVYLDRPFVYAIVDTETSVPIFIGTVNSIQ